MNEDREPLSVVLTSALCKERGPTGRVYLAEQLECRHRWTSYVLRRAKKRRCYSCAGTRPEGNDRKMRHRDRQ